MADRVEIAFDRAARDLLPRGAVVLAAVSGGGDSVAMVSLVARHVERGRLRVIVAHLDHGLRRDSASDRRFVERLAEQLGLACVSERCSVPSLRRRDESPEEAGRRVRRDFLQAAARRSGATVIATGHTLDDQAETILMRLARGAGPTALLGMTDTGPGPFVRPLLGIERDALRAYLERKRVPYLEDPSNEDPRFPRNRVRREVLPLVTAVLNPHAARHIVEAGARLRADSELLDRLAARRLARVATAGRDGRVIVDAGKLASAETALAGRMVRLALERAGVDPRRVSARHVAAVLSLVRGEKGGSLDLPGVLATLKAGELALRRRLQ